MFIAVLVLVSLAVCVVAADTVIVIRNHQAVHTFQAFNERQLHSEALIQTATCVRLNVIRANDNVSHYVDWTVDRRFLQFVIDSASEQRQAKARILTQDHLIAVLKAAIAKKSWIPVSDCSAHSLTELIAPQAVAFNVRLPSAADLH